MEAMKDVKDVKFVGGKITLVRDKMRLTFVLWARSAGLAHTKLHLCEKKCVQLEISRA
jgi:hypothetical protein